MKKVLTTLLATSALSLFSIATQAGPTNGVPATKPAPGAKAPSPAKARAIIAKTVAVVATTIADVAANAQEIRRSLQSIEEDVKSLTDRRKSLEDARAAVARFAISASEFKAQLAEKSDTSLNELIEKDTLLIHSAGQGSDLYDRIFISGQDTSLAIAECQSDLDAIFKASAGKLTQDERQKLGEFAASLSGKIISLRGGLTGNEKARGIGDVITYDKLAVDRLSTALNGDTGETNHIHLLVLVRIGVEAELKAATEFQTAMADGLANLNQALKTDYTAADLTSKEGQTKIKRDLGYAGGDLATIETRIAKVKASSSALNDADIQVVTDKSGIEGQLKAAQDQIAQYKATVAAIAGDLKTYKDAGTLGMSARSHAVEQIEADLKDKTPKDTE